jgi:hypothetical protein
VSSSLGLFDFGRSGGVCSSLGWCIGGGLCGADRFQGLCTIDISIEDAASISADIETPVNAWIAGDGVETDRPEPMSGVVDLDPWKRFS